MSKEGTWRLFTGQVTDERSYSNPQIPFLFIVGALIRFSEP
jgi:hypothetical protein